VIDLRSDFCAPPTEEMWEAMQAARLGWASAGEDETVRRLERLVAEDLGKAAAVFVPTCTIANLVALLSLETPGRAAVVEATSHVLVAEARGIESVAGLLPIGLRGLEADEVEAAVVTRRATVLCLENTHTRAGGTVLGVDETAALAHAAHRHGARVHLDGARLTNAAAALDVPVADLAAPADTVAVSLNKGLCAPYGALLAGDEETIAAARGHLRRLGGATVHKAGLLAAAGLVAWEWLRDRLPEDHRRARELGERLAEAGVGVEPDRVESNIVLAEVDGAADEALAAIAAAGVLALAPDGARLRFVTHRGIGDADVEQAAAAIASALAYASG
jgi:threonine aldolase